MDVVVVNKMLEEDNKVMEEVNKKLVKEYNIFFGNFSNVRLQVGGGHGCRGGRGCRQGGRQGIGQGGQGVQ